MVSTFVSGARAVSVSRNVVASARDELSSPRGELLTCSSVVIGLLRHLCGRQAAFRPRDRCPSGISAPGRPSPTRHPPAPLIPRVRGAAPSRAASPAAVSPRSPSALPRRRTAGRTEVRPDRWGKPVMSRRGEFTLSSVDDYLGPAAGRFFGSGYRRVGYHLDHLLVRAYGDVPRL